MTNQILSVPDISCDHCKTSIEGAVGKLDGITSVEVSVDAKTVSVDFDEATLAVEAIATAIEDQGYEVEAT